MKEVKSNYIVLPLYSSFYDALLVGKKL